MKALDTQALAGQLDQVIDGLDLECLGVEWRPSGGEARLRVYIDRQPDGVTIDDCEAASREISAWLDVEDPIAGHYLLEVSSPGIDRPLFNVEQYRKAVGERVKLALKLARDGRRRFAGVVESVDDNTVNLRVNGDEVAIALADIDHGRVDPDWQALGYEPRAKPGARGARRGKNKGRSGRDDAPSGANGNE